MPAWVLLHTIKIKTSTMKKITCLLFVACSVFTISSCNSSTETKDPVEVAKDTNDVKADDKTMAINEDDSKFLVFAADAGMTEIRSAELAKTQSISAGTKEFADMMIKDHTAAGDEVKALAATKNVTLPATVGEDHQKAINDLGTKKAGDFEKAYISMMVDDHQKVVDKFKDAAEHCKDSDVKALATKMLPTLQSHLDHAKTLQSSVGKK